MKKQLLMLAGGLILLGAFANANAALVTGSIEFGGAASAQGGVNSPTGIIFGMPVFAFGGQGDLSVMDTASNFPSGGLTMTNILNFGAFTPQTVWQTGSAFGDFSFTLTSMTLTQGINSFALIGSGVITHASGMFDATDATFNLTFNSSGKITGSMSSSVAAVPIPAAGLLFGSALIGFAAVARRRAKVVGAANA